LVLNKQISYVSNSYEGHHIPAALKRNFDVLAFVKHKRVHHQYANCQQWLSKSKHILNIIMPKSFYIKHYIIILNTW